MKCVGCAVGWGGSCDDGGGSVCGRSYTNIHCLYISRSIFIVITMTKLIVCPIIRELCLSFYFYNNNKK